MNQMKTKIMLYKLKKKFAFYYIKQLFDSNFDIKPQMSTIEPSLALASLILLLSTLILLAFILTNILIYSMQLSGIKPTLKAYIQSLDPKFTSKVQMPSLRLTFAAYIESLDIEFLLAIYTLLCTKLISAAYIQLFDIKFRTAA